MSTMKVRDGNDEAVEMAHIFSHENHHVSPELYQDKIVSVDPLRTDNLIITGDNVEALKLLLYEYSAKINMIYVDPPYNTGRHFTFRDSFGKDGRQSKSTPGKDRRSNRHTLWRDFMFPRLQAARKLLSEDGTIFISIDDNEVYNLRLMLNDIFGEKNFIATMIRRSGIAPRQDAKHVAIQHDYVVCYAKNIGRVRLNRKASSLKGFVWQDEFVGERGRYRLNKLDRGSIRYCESLDYPIVAPDGSKVWPGGDPADRKWTWRWSRKKVEWGVENGFVVFRKNREGKYSVYFKEYESVDNSGRPRKRTNPYSSVITGAHNEKGNADLKALFNRRVFDYPKPVVLIKHLLRMATDKNSLVLDFFAGAGSTGHAVWELNAEDGGKRRFILIQNDEPVQDRDIAQDYPTVADICIERMRRASRLYEKREISLRGDFGFKVLRIRQAQ